MTVRELLSKISSHEIMEWRAFFKIKNFREQQAMEMSSSNATKFRGQALPT